MLCLNGAWRVSVDCVSPQLRWCSRQAGNGIAYTLTFLFLVFFPFLGNHLSFFYLTWLGVSLGLFESVGRLMSICAIPSSFSTTLVRG